VWKQFWKGLEREFETTVKSALAAAAKKYSKMSMLQRERLSFEAGIKSQEEYVDRERKTLTTSFFTQLKSFQTVCPLRPTAGGYAFVHKSFFEYFLAHAIL
jgi:hypothetical protein